MVIRGKSIFAIVAAGMLGVAEYLHLVSELVSRMFGETQLAAISKVATNAAVWVFVLCLVPATARLVVRVCDFIGRITDRATAWLLGQLILWAQAALGRSSAQVRPY